MSKDCPILWASLEKAKVILPNIKTQKKKNNVKNIKKTPQIDFETSIPKLVYQKLAFWERIVKCERNSYWLLLKIVGNNIVTEVCSFEKQDGINEIKKTL